MAMKRYRNKSLRWLRFPEQDVAPGAEFSREYTPAMEGQHLDGGTIEEVTTFAVDAIGFETSDDTLFGDDPAEEENE
jgi:hypothetical protein